MICVIIKNLYQRIFDRGVRNVPIRDTWDWTMPQSFLLSLFSRNISRWYFVRLVYVPRSLNSSYLINCMCLSSLAVAHLLIPVSLSNSISCVCYSKEFHNRIFFNLGYAWNERSFACFIFIRQYMCTLHLAICWKRCHSGWSSSWFSYAYLAMNYAESEIVC